MRHPAAVVVLLLVLMTPRGDAQPCMPSPTYKLSANLPAAPACLTAGLSPTLANVTADVLSCFVLATLNLSSSCAVLLAPTAPQSSAGLPCRLYSLSGSATTTFAPAGVGAPTMLALVLDGPTLLAVYSNATLLSSLPSYLVAMLYQAYNVMAQPPPMMAAGASGRRRQILQVTPPNSLLPAAFNITYDFASVSLTNAVSPSTAASPPSCTLPYTVSFAPAAAAAPTPAGMPMASGTPPATPPPMSPSSMQSNGGVAGIAAVVMGLLLVGGLICFWQKDVIVNELTFGETGQGVLTANPVYVAGPDSPSKAAAWDRAVEAVAVGPEGHTLLGSEDTDHASGADRRTAPPSSLLPGMGGGGGGDLELASTRFLAGHDGSSGSAAAPAAPARPAQTLNQQRLDLLGF